MLCCKDITKNLQKGACELLYLYSEILTDHDFNSAMVYYVRQNVVVIYFNLLLVFNWFVCFLH